MTRPAVTAFALLADPTRVRVLWSLPDTSLNVTSLAEAGGCQPTIANQHLARLRLAGPVDRARDARRVIYSARGGHVRNLLTEALFHADHQVSRAPTHDWRGSASGHSWVLRGQRPMAHRVRIAGGPYRPLGDSPESRRR
jgi:DNA-binding transcriptional ArsR family regulator